MIDEKKLIEELKKRIALHEKTSDDFADENIHSDGVGLFLYLADEIQAVIELVKKQPKIGEWIQFKARKADDEERVVYGCDEMLECNLPDEDEDILVTYASGKVCSDTFLREEYECSLDSGAQFISEVIAWMPLPEPYRGDEE